MDKEKAKKDFLFGNNEGRTINPPGPKANKQTHILKNFKIAVPSTSNRLISHNI
jgi:hypothetical protein